MQCSFAGAAILALSLPSGALAMGGELSTGLAQTGKSQFIRCVACHSPRSGARPQTGPHLEGIVGRRAASVEGFPYSSALRGRDFVWDEARLDRFLRSPQAEIAGLCLPFMGMAGSADRKALIAYLKDPAP